MSAQTASAYCRSTTCTGDCERDEDGCKTTGEPLFWSTSCVGFSLQADSSVHIPFKYFEDTAQKAFVEWSDLECETGVATLSFSQLESVACHEAEYNTGGTNANVILFQDTKWNYTGVDNNLAKTTVTFDPDTGEILDADIEVNHANNNFTISDMVIEYDLQAILTHEIGHFVGIDHSPDFSATMYAGYEPGTTDQRTLEFDDIAAACEVYPPEREATCSPNPRGGLGDQCGGEGDDGGDGTDGDEDSCSFSAKRTASGGGQWLFLAAAASMAYVQRSRRRSSGSNVGALR